MKPKNYWPWLVWIFNPIWTSIVPPKHMSLCFNSKKKKKTKESANLCIIQIYVKLNYLKKKNFWLTGSDLDITPLFWSILGAFCHGYCSMEERRENEEKEKNMGFFHFHKRIEERNDQENKRRELKRGWVEKKMCGGGSNGMELKWKSVFINKRLLDRWVSFFPVPNRNNKNWESLGENCGIDFTQVSSVKLFFLKREVQLYFKRGNIVFMRKILYTTFLLKNKYTPKSKME